MTGTDIVVTLRSVSATLSTAVQVKAALDADPNVAHLLTTALVDAGSGEVTALTKTALALA